MRRLLVLPILLALPFLSISGLNVGPAAIAHADSGKVNWSQSCAATDNSGGTHGACVSYYVSIKGVNSFCEGAAASIGSWNFVLTFYGDQAETQVLAGPIPVTNAGSCVSTIAQEKGLPWVLLVASPA